MNRTIKEMADVIAHELKRVRMEIMAHGLTDFDERTESALETLAESVKTLEAFAFTIRSLRNAQSCFDVTGSGKYLGEKLRLEKAVDELVKDIIAEEPPTQERMPDGTEVHLEMGSGSSKSEFVEAVIIGYSEGKPCVQTHWGAVFNLVDPKRVTRRVAQFAMLLVCFLFGSCGMFQEPKCVHPTIAPFVGEFYSLAQRRGIIIEHRPSVAIGELERSSERGLYYARRNQVVISKEFIEKHLNISRADSNFIRLVVYHELGHAMGQAHRAGLSVMNSGDLFEGAGDFIHTVQEFNRVPDRQVAILDELFFNPTAKE